MPFFSCQGLDFLIEIEGETVSVYGSQALKFLERPWNRHRSMKASSIQFSFVAFNELAPYLGRLKQTFPNLTNYEFFETDINALGQLNALSMVQGISSLVIGEGNPVV